MNSSLNYLFKDRSDAGQRLGELLKTKKIIDPILLALPRGGGVVVGDEIAKMLHVPLDVVISRKIGAPGHPEFGIGAVSEDGSTLLNPSVSKFLDPQSAAIAKTISLEKIELNRRVKSYRGGQSLPDMKGKTVVVIDDGVATGVTAAAAAKFLKSLHPQKIILAVPLGPEDINPDVKDNFDEVICLYELKDMISVGQWYEQFSQVEDKQVLNVLNKYH
jgi:putative phosphoribosyl transferase